MPFCNIDRVTAVKMILQTAAWDEPEEVQNCTESQICSSCPCFMCNGNGCVVRCSKDYCFCHGYTNCWRKDWSLVTATQVSIFILFVLGIVSVMIMYFRVCNRALHRDYSGYPSLRGERNNERNPNVTQISIMENRDRPPSYSEACSAPPLYNSPYNRVSMLEPPPVYPETPKLSGRNSQLDNPVVTNHM